MGIPVITKTAYTDQGNKYTKSRVGKIAGAVGLGMAGNISANKMINSPGFPEYVKRMQLLMKNMTETAGNTFELADVKQATKEFGRQIKTSTIAFAAITGLVLGAIADFAINNISKLAANKKANQDKA